MSLPTRFGGKAKGCRMRRRPRGRGRQGLQMALASACARMRLGGGGDSTVDGLMEFFGAAGQGTTTDALNIVKKFCVGPRYCRPTDEPVELDEANARLYVLGPPH